MLFVGPTCGDPALEKEIKVIELPLLIAERLNAFSTSRLQQLGSPEAADVDEQTTSPCRRCSD